MPSATKNTKPVAEPADNITASRGPAVGPLGDSDAGPSTNLEPAYLKNDRPHGFTITVTGGVAALINAVLVCVLMFQTWAVYDQLQLSREALENSNVVNDNCFCRRCLSHVGREGCPHSTPEERNRSF